MRFSCSAAEDDPGPSPVLPGGIFGLAAGAEGKQSRDCACRGGGIDVESCENGILRATGAVLGFVDPAEEGGPFPGCDPDVEGNAGRPVTAYERGPHVVNVGPWNMQPTRVLRHTEPHREEVVCRKRNARLVGDEQFKAAPGSIPQCKAEGARADDRHKDRRRNGKRSTRPKRQVKQDRPAKKQQDAERYPQPNRIGEYESATRGCRTICDDEVWSHDCQSTAKGE